MCGIKCGIERTALYSKCTEQYNQIWIREMRGVLSLLLRHFVTTTGIVQWTSINLGRSGNWCWNTKLDYIALVRAIRRLYTMRPSVISTYSINTCKKIAHTHTHYAS